MTRFAYLPLALFAFTLHWLLLHPLLAGQHSTSADEMDAGIWIFVCCWILLEAYWLKTRAAARRKVADKRADLWQRMRQWLEQGAGAPMTREEAQAELNRHTRQILDNLAPASTTEQGENHLRDALLYGISAQKVWMEDSQLKTERIPAPVLIAVDLAHPDADQTVCVDAALWRIMADGMITPEKMADVRRPAVLRARRKGKKFTYDRVEATA
jgi:hypothetical protein